MTVLAAGAAWIAAHFLLYVTFLRRRPAFRSEAVILVYHVISCGVAAVGAVCGTILGDAPAAGTIAAVSLHGIYSMSFLSLWSSAQGGFALHILKALDGGPQLRAQLVDTFVRTGDAKRDARLAHLRGGGFIDVVDDVWYLTPRGRWLARVIALLHGLHNLRSVG